MSLLTTNQTCVMLTKRSKMNSSGYLGVWLLISSKEPKKDVYIFYYKGKELDKSMFQSPVDDQDIIKYSKC